MRISDWSSDVCSSDLNAKVVLHLLVDVDQARRHPHPRLHRKAQAMRLPRPVIGVLPQDHDPHVPRRRRVERREPVARPRINRLALGRSEERRVGKECVTTCRSRRSPYPQKTKTHITQIPNTPQLKQQTPYRTLNLTKTHNLKTQHTY